MKLGLVTSELFAPGITGIGGFGWATRQVARLFSGDPALGVEPVLLMARPVAAGAMARPTLHGCRIVWRAPGLLAHLRRLRAERFDLLLVVDNQAAFRLVHWAWPRTPVIFWLRDPWPPGDRATIATLRIPGDASPPQGLWARDLRSFRWDHRLARALGRKMLFAAPARLVGKKFEGTFGFKPERVHELPNIIDLGAGRVTKTAKPSVVVVGRLDPIKRPWIAAAVAAEMPEVDFFFLGQNHFQGPGSWQPRELPGNAHLLGHTDGERKTQLLSRAWVLLNTSIHEGLPVTFQEALAAETPVVSCLDPDGVTTRFGIFVGEAHGDGLELVPKFVTALHELFRDHTRREQLGRDGRAWIEAAHTRKTFLEGFRQLCAEAGVAER